MEPKREKVFANGLIFKRPKEGAPEFIKGNISIKIADFIAFLKEHGAGQEWVNLDLKSSKEGKLYCELNTWKKEEKKEEVSEIPF